MAEKLFILCTHGAEDPERATIPFVMATAAQAMDVVVVLGLGLLLMWFLLDPQNPVTVYFFWLLAFLGLVACVLILAGIHVFMKSTIGGAKFLSHK